MINRRSALTALSLGSAAASLLVPQAKAQGIASLGVDDPNNVSGLGAPAIIRGTVYAHLASGVTVGAGQTTGVRQATAIGLQNAINYAANNNKIFEINPGIYEINSSTGLVLPDVATSNFTGFTWRGSRAQTQINQFYNGGTGAPILTIGDAVFANRYLVHLDFDGVQLNYTTDQTGLTSSNALVLGSLAWGRVNNVSIGVEASSRAAYNAVHWATSSFAMTYNDWDIWFAQNTFLNCGGNVNGSLFSNTYLNNGGSGSYNPISGNYVILGPAVQQENKFCQLNCEWGATNQILNIQGMFGTIIEGLHIEGIKLTGFTPVVLVTANAALHIDTMNLVNVICDSGNLSGSPAMIADYAPGPSNITINNLLITYYTASEINTGLLLYSPVAMAAGTNHGTCSIDKVAFVDQTSTGQMNGFVSVDSHMPTGAAQFLLPTRFSEYEWGVSGSILRGAVIPVSAAYTHYGQLVDATLIIPTSITSFIVTLADTMGASGNQLPTTGNRCHITRETGSASGTLTIKDGAGATLTTNTTAPAELDYIFNGTAWVAFTPVT